MSDAFRPFPKPPALHPDRRFLFSRLSHLIALGLGAGLSRRAPGTMGTLWAWVSFLLIDRFVPGDAGWALILGLGLLAGWWASTATINRLKNPDPGCVVIDEIVAFWAILWLGQPHGFSGHLGLFLLFRYFDAAKPGPVAWADRAFKGLGWRGGWGIMFDDLVAACCTLLVFAFWRWL